ncbi:uncharacterized protein EI90DRAFT_1106712 [Cantharellus anzutake]|uniref:uncharacterized protein n=1 Tax=Cantharellus anzutake TaxID=1750568 RepID=UPI00190306E6|nr:uncharacterized protein EI90DRAFT_1106712 [Cantharellus anzutake]KAF8330872.1 hypothetical protein EI90DRAFT_1106712 [Cantharellus anzutake]
METTTGDAPFSVDLSALESAVYCPNGIRKAAGGVVLLVHGTGSTGYESWANGPYGVYLPWAAPGFDVCWVDLPRNSLIDAQVSAEYIAYNIPLLAAKSSTGKVSIIGHSQGAGLNPQWALDFWPSIRQYVSDYIALAGDFHGTLEGPVSCLSQDLLHSGCYPSVAQQTAGSKYLEAQNERGGSALVTTTSIYTRYDDVIQPEVVNPTSVLPGAANLALQDPAYTQTLTCVVLCTKLITLLFSSTLQPMLSHMTLSLMTDRLQPLVLTRSNIAVLL